MLGAIVREKYHTDYYVLHRYPKDVRPFYTMHCHDDPNYTCSFDAFIRGEEILSGAQRQHDPVILEANIKAKGVDPDSVRQYINAFTYGAQPHGGTGIGMERVVKLFTGIHNIKTASMFPRDPKRIIP
jgi:aspartyl/asparaginyl-tRNA synthetase